MDNNDFKTDIDPEVIADVLDGWEVTDLSVDEGGFHFRHRGREVHIGLVWAVEVGEQESAHLEHGECLGEPQSAMEVLRVLLHRYRYPPIDLQPLSPSLQIASVDV